jgi:hypothetical protein
VDYRVADLLAQPVEWPHTFDLVVEIFTVQALPDPPRAAAIRAVASLVAPGGALLAIAFRHTPGVSTDDGPPFALTREMLDGFAADGLTQVRTEELDGPLWRVELRA